MIRLHFWSDAPPSCSKITVAANILYCHWSGGVRVTYIVFFKNFPNLNKYLLYFHMGQTIILKVKLKITF